MRVFGASGVEMICCVDDANQTSTVDDEASVVRVKWLTGRGAIALLLDTWNIYIFHIVTLSNSRRGEMGLGMIHLKFTFKNKTVFIQR